jgi:hypothetical protein
MIEPPSKGAIDSAVKRLKDVGALEQVFNFLFKLILIFFEDLNCWQQIDIFCFDFHEIINRSKFKGQ